MTDCDHDWLPVYYRSAEGAPPWVAGWKCDICGVWDGPFSYSHTHKPRSNAPTDTLAGEGADVLSRAA